MATNIKTTRLLKHAGITRILVNDDDPEQRYQMAMPAGEQGDDGSLGWRLAHHSKPSWEDLQAAVSIMSTFEYMLSALIPAEEAINRLRCLRREYQRQHKTA